MNKELILPHGGVLRDKTASSHKILELEQYSRHLPAIHIDDRIANDCEMLASGAFSPLDGFMSKADALSVINDMHLSEGLLWTIPILLPIKEEQRFASGEEIALIDSENRIIAIIEAGEHFELDLADYCQKVYKTEEHKHPGVEAVMQYGNLFLEARLLQLINRPLRKEVPSRSVQDPRQIRDLIAKKSWKTIVAFQTRNPIHRAHEYLIKCALELVDGALIHPIVGETKKDDIPASVRMKCYEVLIDNYFNKQRIILSALPMAMRYAGPREAIHHMIVRQNYGCTHMIIGRDHAGVGNYYGTYEAQEMITSFAEELRIEAIKFDHAFYSKKCESMVTEKSAPGIEGDIIHLSGSRVREMLQKGLRPPREFTREEVADVLIKWTKEQCLSLPTI